MVTSEIPLGNLDLNQFEYPLPFACSQRSRLATAFRFIRVGTPLLGASPVLFSNTTPWASDLPWAWTTSKAPLCCRSDGSPSMPGYLGLPDTITYPELLWCS